MGSEKLDGEYGIEVGGWKGMGSRVWKWEVGWGVGRVGNVMREGIEVGVWEGMGGRGWKWDLGWGVENGSGIWKGMGNTWVKVFRIVPEFRMLN